MDDIYFNKRNKRNSNEQNSYDMPSFQELPFDDSDSKKNIDIPDFSINPVQNTVSYPDSVQDETYAPYTGKSRRKKKYAPYRGKQKRNREPEPVDYEVPILLPEEEEKQKPKTKRKRSKVRTIAKVLLVIFCLSFIGVFMTAATAGYTKTKLKRNEFVNSANLISHPLVRNILLIGVDGTDSSQSLRSDSMMLVSIDSVHSKIKLVSFMRDSWLEIPGYKYAKLNAACSHGGPQLVVDTIEYNFGVDIEDYVLVNFTMFTDIIDTIGGIDVEVTKKEADFINRTTRHTVESGSNVHLNGAEALVYCRIRKLDSDHMRTFRQRKVIKALIKQAKGTGVFKLLEAMHKVLPMVETDMGAFKLTCLFFRGGFSALIYKIQSTRIPTDELSWYGTKGSQSVVELDVEKNAAHLQEFIYSNNIRSEEEAQ